LENGNTMISFQFRHEIRVKKQSLGRAHSYLDNPSSPENKCKSHLHEKMQTNMLNETKLNKKTQTRIKVTYKQPAVVLDPSAVSAKLLEIKETNQK
jgi:hypothetical protein